MNPPSLIHVKTRLQDATLDPSCFRTVCFATFRLTRALESRLEKCACPPSHTSFIKHVRVTRPRRKQMMHQKRQNSIDYCRQVVLQVPQAIDEILGSTWGAISVSPSTIGFKMPPL